MGAISAYQNRRVLAKMEARVAQAASRHSSRPIPGSMETIHEFAATARTFSALRPDRHHRPGRDRLYPSSPGQLELGRHAASKSCRPSDWPTPRQDAHGIVLATIPATRAGADRHDRLQFASRHLARNQRRGRQAAGDSQLLGRRHSAARSGRPGDPRGRQSRAGRLARPDAHHHRRHDAAGRPTTRPAWPSSWRRPPG